MKVKALSELISLRTLQKIQDFYALALGIPLTIRDYKGKTLTKLSNSTTLWNYIHSHPEIEKKLSKNLAEAVEKCQRTGQIVIFERHPDSQAFLAPIYINGKIFAFFVGGLVRFGNPNLTVAAEMAKQLKIDLDTYLDAYLSLPLFTKDRLEAAANLIKVIGNTISTLELQGNEIKSKNEIYQQKNQELTKNIENLDASIDRYKTLFESINDGVYLCDMNGVFLEINQAGARMLGYSSPAEVIGKKARDSYVYPEDRENFTKILLKENSINDWLAHIITPSGEERYFETNATLLRNEKGQPTQIQGIFRNINERHHRPI